MKINLPNQWSPRDYQQPLWDALAGGVKRALAVWHRRSGKDAVMLHHNACSAFERVGNYWYLMPEYSQCRKALWDAVNPHSGKKRIDEAFPREIRKRTLEQEMKIEFLNGSTFQLVGSDNYDSLVGSTPVGVSYSEYGLSDPSSWGFIRPILLENDGWALFNSTPRGKNHLYKMKLMAEESDDWFCQTLTADETDVFTAAQLKSELDEIVAEHGEVYGRALWLQEYFCFPSDTRIFTDKGQIEIKDIKLGDTVLSHTGRWRKVTKLYQHEHDDGLIEIKSYGSCEPLRCTPEHPVRVCNQKTQSYRWVQAKNIKCGDLVVLPRLKASKSTVITKELAELVAWFIAEGSVFKNAVQFALNKTETDYAERIKNCAKQFGKVSISESETTLNVTVNSCFLADFMTTNCGSGAKNKHMPWNLIAGHEEIVYETLIDGDGCRGDYSGISEVYTTISYSLAIDVQMLAHMIGKRASINKTLAEKRSQYILGRKCNISDSYSVRISRRRKHPPKNNAKPKILPQKHGVAAVVSKVEHIGWHGTVYNFSVQYDESYIAEGRIVHNCSFDAALPGSIWGEATTLLAKRGGLCSVPHTDGYPVHSAWDLGKDDDTAIWFYQVVDNSLKVIDYHAKNFKDVDYYAEYLRDHGKENNWRYGTHWLPHDARPDRMGQGGKTILQQFINYADQIEDENNYKIGSFAITPSFSKQDGIQAARKTFQIAYFDKSRCEDGFEHLKAYKRKFDEKEHMFSSEPAHDKASHASDAWRYLSLTWKESKKTQIILSPKQQLLRGNIASISFGEMTKRHFKNKRRQRAAL